MFGKIDCAPWPSHRPSAPRCCPMFQPEYLPGYEASIYVGIAAPHGTPSAVVEQLNKTINLAFVDANVSRRIADLGDAPLSLSSSEFAKLVIEETEKWRKVIVAGNIRAE